MTFLTTDLCDANEGRVRVVAPMFKSHAPPPPPRPPTATAPPLEAHSLVRETLTKLGAGEVLVVDGGGSLRCALVGDQIAELAVKNQWAGIVVYGCIRDSVAINGLPLGVRAIDTHPLKSIKKGAGDCEIAVTFGGVTFTPGEWLYADEDGVIVSATPLL